MTAFPRRVVVVLFALTLSATVAVAGQATKSSDLLTSKQVKELVVNAKTPADHVKLQKHFLALAQKYDAEAQDHVVEAEAYRKNPMPWERKGSAGIGTSVHCDRIAELDRQAAKEARDLAMAHEHMAAAVK